MYGGGKYGAVRHEVPRFMLPAVRGTLCLAESTIIHKVQVTMEIAISSVESCGVP